MLKVPHCCCNSFRFIETFSLYYNSSCCFTWTTAIPDSSLVVFLIFKTIWEKKKNLKKKTKPTFFYLQVFDWNQSGNAKMKIQDVPLSLLVGWLRAPQQHSVLHLPLILKDLILFYCIY